MEDSGAAYTRQESVNFILFGRYCLPVCRIGCLKCVRVDDVIPELPYGPVHEPSPPEASILVLCVEGAFPPSLGECTSRIDPLLYFRNEGTFEEEVERVKFSCTKVTTAILIFVFSLHKKFA